MAASAEGARATGSGTLLRRALARPLDALVVVGAVLGTAAFVAWSGQQVVNHTWLIPAGAEGSDWNNLANLDPGDPYATGAFVWSPLAAWLWVALIVPLGIWVWRAVHLASLLLLRDRWAIAAALITFPFWADLLNGNTVVFQVVTAWLALRGSRAGVIAFCILAVLIPRPVILPVLLVLLVKRKDARVAFLAATAVVVGEALLAGRLDDWLTRLAATPASEISQLWNKGPSRIIGPAWIPVGIALGLLATWRGWPGIGGLLMTPYLTHYYILVALVDMPRARAMVVGSWRRLAGAAPHGPGVATASVPSSSGENASSMNGEGAAGS